jgi:chromosomal replication initiation ATPase DnaA
MSSSRRRPTSAEHNDTVRHAGLTQIVAAQAFGVPLAKVCAAERGDRSAARARQVAMYLSHVVFCIDGGTVAETFGRSRTAAYHAFRRIETLRDDPDLDRTLSRLESVLRSAVEGV